MTGLFEKNNICICRIVYQKIAMKQLEIFLQNVLWNFYTGH